MRLKRVLLSSELLLSLFEEGVEHHVRCVRGLPSGTRFVRVLQGPIYGIELMVSHESFPELADGDEIPIFEKPLFEKISTRDLISAP